MIHIVGVNIPRDERMVVSLTYIYDIGNTTAERILADVGVPEDARVRELTNERTDAIHAEVDRLKVEEDLRREANLNIKRLVEIGSYREVRHRRGLPVRRQNTENNAHTHKGPAHAIAGEKK